MRDDETKPATDTPATTPDRGVEAADAAIDAEATGAAAPKKDLEKAETAGREGGTR